MPSNRTPLNTVVLGATRGIGRAIARQLVERGDRVFLLGTQSSELDKTLADLSARGSTPEVAVGHAHCDLEKPETFATSLDAAKEALGDVDAIIVTAGIFATQDQLEDNIELTEKLLRIDFTNTVLFCEEARKLLLAQDGGTLCVFSSVAGERGRTPVVLYGASKAGLSAYLEGLDHRYHKQGLRVITVKPGFVKTGMTSGLPVPPFAGEPEEVAKAAIFAIDHEIPVMYAPLAWAGVMGVIRALPRAVMRRVKF